MSEPTYLAPGTALQQRYEIVREIGRGGCSVVYLATDRTLGAPVAIKLLVPPPASARLARERLSREVQAVRGLAHEHIVAVYDLLDDGGWSFVVMEYVDGPDLAERVRQRGPLLPDDAARLGGDVARALSEAHRHGILHRDVKPQNILLAPDGRARLTDFGAARLEGQATVTQTGGLVGTPAYIAPELFQGQRGDARSDVYSLGLTLFFGLTGRLPDRMQPHGPPEPAGEGHHPRSARADVPDGLDRVVARATAADPADRYHTADELARALAEGDDRAAAPYRRATALDFCLVCGSGNAAGLAACPDCGGAPAGRQDTLVFVDGPRDAAAREALERSLGELLARPAGAPDLRAAARGRRALLRVSRAGAAQVAAQLRARDVPARLAPVGRAWSAVPPALYGVVAAAGVTGVVAGGVAMPFFLVSTPLVVGLMLVSAHRAVREPLVATAARRSPLPDDVDRKVSASLGRIPAGPARRLLVDLARLAQRAPTAEVVELLAAACDAAEDLAGLDESLRVLERREESERGGPALGESVLLCERARDRLVQQLLAALAAMARTQSQATGRADAELGELARALADRSERDAAALREVDALLAGGGARA